jgi:hypothetical protein
VSGADRDLEALEQRGDLADELRDKVCRAAGGQSRRDTSLEESPGEPPAGDKGLRELAERTNAVENADTIGEWTWRGKRA